MYFCKMETALLINLGSEKWFRFVKFHALSPIKYSSPMNALSLLLLHSAERCMTKMPKGSFAPLHPTVSGPNSAQVDLNLVNHLVDRLFRDLVDVLLRETILAFAYSSPGCWIRRVARCKGAKPPFGFFVIASMALDFQNFHIFSKL